MPYTQDYNDKMNAYMKASRKKNPEKHRERERQYAASLKRDAFEKLGNKCSNCGSTVKEILEINHINGGGCKERRKIDLKAICRKVIRGSDDYNLLCRVCNSLHYVCDILGHKGYEVIWKEL